MSLVHLQLEMLLRVCRVYYVPFFTGLKHFVVCPNLRLHNTFPSYDFFFFFFFLIILFSTNCFSQIMTMTMTMTPIYICFFFMFNIYYDLFFFLIILI